MQKQHATPAQSGPNGAPRVVAPLVQRERSDQVAAIGLRTPWLRDLYHNLLILPMADFSRCSGLRLFGTEHILCANARPGAFADAIFFSVETLSTISYGQMSPATLYGHIVMTGEALVGLMLIAVAAGLMFARFSRPTARVLFSKVAVIAPHDGVPTLTLRLANVRRNQILEAQVSVTLVRDERTAEGEWMRRFYDLRLARHRSPIFAMTFTVMHEIDPTSPLSKATPSSLAAESAEIVVTVLGIDEVTVQPVYARASYLAHEVLWNRRFVDVFTQTEAGRLAIDYRLFHDTEPIEPRTTSGR